MKKMFALAGFALALLLAAQTAWAAAPNYSRLNKSYDTLKISDDGSNRSLSNLFNNFFGLKGDQRYDTADDLYQDRSKRADGNYIGEKTWMFENADSETVYSASFKSAGYGHNLVAQGTNGARLGSHYFKSGEDQTSWESVEFTVTPGQDFSWALECYSNPRESDDGRLLSGSTPDYTLRNDEYRSRWSSRWTEDFIHMITLDVSDLVLEAIQASGDEWYQAYITNWEDYFGEDAEGNLVLENEAGLNEAIAGFEGEFEAYMICWEDLRGTGGPDYDYQDLVGVVSSYKLPDSFETEVDPPVTPEPATMLILGLGLAGLPFAGRLSRKQK